MTERNKDRRQAEEEKYSDRTDAADLFPIVAAPCVQGTRWLLLTYPLSLYSRFSLVCTQYRVQCATFVADGRIPIPVLCTIQLHR